MANYASNHLSISGEYEDLRRIYNLLEKYQKDTTKGHSPLDGNKNQWDHIYMFDIDFHQEELKISDKEFAVTCESKWAEPKDTLKFISHLFNVSIINSVQEMGAIIYGESYYHKGKKILEIYIDQDETLEYNEEKDGYIDPETGEVMESEYEYYDNLIEDKKNIIRNLI